MASRKCFSRKWPPFITIINFIMRGDVALFL